MPCRFSLFVNKSLCQFNFRCILSSIGDLFVLPHTLHVNLIWLINQLIYHKGSIRFWPITPQYGRHLHHEELLDSLQIALRYDKWSSMSSNEFQLKSHNSPCNNYGLCFRCATTPRPTECQSP